MYFEKLKTSLIVVVAMVGMFAGQTFAQPLEDVSLQYGSDGIVATIKLSGPVTYLRHFPAEQSKTLEIFYDRVKDSSTETWRDDESLQSPPSGLIPGFTVTTRDQKVRPKLVIEFSRMADFTVAQGADGRSILITIKPDRQQRKMSDVIPALPTVKPLALALGAAVPDQATGEVNKQAFEFMTAGRDALAGKDNSTAIEVFNKLLLLPPNPYTTDAQEWVGVARERAGQDDRAKAEYELYIKMYPNGEGVERVKIRLDGVGNKKSTVLEGTAAEGQKKTTQSMAFGGISSRYYYGNSTIDATYTNALNGTTTANYSGTDQSMLITNVDATERFVDENTDSRLVFRDIQTHNYMTTQSVYSTQNTNRVNTAYWESKDRTNTYSYRLGRQLGYGGGVMGRYDGATASYAAADSWKTNAVIGKGVDFTATSQPFFYGASVDKGPVSLYAINQTVDGLLDRRAIGSELRYFESGRSGYAQLDYDVSFKALNVAMMNGMVGIGSDGTNLTFMADYRKAPMLSTRNALIGSTATSASSLLQIMTESQLRDLALSRTGTSNFYQVGVTHPLNTKWQVGGDLKLSKMSGIPATDPALTNQLTPGQQLIVGTIPVTPGTGVTRTVTTQLIGNSLLTKFDIWSFSLNFMMGDISSGNSLFVYNHTLLKNKWTLDSSWLYYKQDTIGSGTTTRNTPMVRATYRYMDRLSFDGDFGLEFSKTEGSFVTSTGTRKFMSLGLRWDF